MDIIRAALNKPTAVIAVVIVIIISGLLALLRIPIQLIPDVDKPVIIINTIWPGASPAEIEREITIPQEEKLKGLDGLTRLISRSQYGESEIEMEFAIEQNMQEMLLLVSNRLDQVEDYPAEADKPQLKKSRSEDSAIAWFILTRKEGNTTPIDHYGDLARDVIQDRFERVAGVSRSNVYGGSEKELRITIDPQKMADHQITIADLITIIRRNHIAITSGDVDEAKRRYLVRIEGELNTPDALKNIIIRTIQSDEQTAPQRIRLGDIAQIDYAWKTTYTRIRALGKPAIAINAVRESGSNVITVMEQLRAQVDALNTHVLPQKNLELRQVYDETTYIESAIDLVIQNIYLGGSLAILILLLFLRSLPTTLIAALAIPVSVIGAFVAMAFLGRSLNVISLAGIAFAVGMVVDATIVVLDNIFRLRQENKSPHDAAYYGAKNVWAAVFVSALTTVIVFLPLLMSRLEVGQLFRDIAVAISVSVILSLIVSITLVPVIAQRFLVTSPNNDRFSLPRLDAWARQFVQLLIRFTRNVAQNRHKALRVALSITTASLLFSWIMLPKLDYLPEGNRNLIFGILLPPPGYNLETVTTIAQSIEDSIKHLFITESGTEPNPQGPPKMSNFFFVALPSITFMGARSQQPERVKELIPILTGLAFKEPGMYGLVNQPSLFGRGIGQGRSIDITIDGTDINAILQTAQQAAFYTTQALPPQEGTQMRPQPGLELGAPEIQLLPNSIALSDVGMTRIDFANTIRSFHDGVRIEEIVVDGRRIDLTLRAPENSMLYTQNMKALPIVTPAGIVPTSNLATIKMTAGPTEIRRHEQRRSINLQIRPPPKMPLEQAIDILNSNVIAPLEQKGLPPDTNLTIAGTADELTKTWNSMVLDLILALLIVYLAMAVLFENFFYPLIILLTVPVAMAGGVAGLVVLNMFTFQPLDMLTLLGFIILTGIVVNNAILLIHQTLHHMKDDAMPIPKAVETSVRNRIRPIFMSTLTSLFGMIPLVIFPGAGSELYRGLGSVVLGGLALSSILTLMIVPPILSVFVHAIEKTQWDSLSIIMALGRRLKNAWHKTYQRMP